MDAAHEINTGKKVPTDFDHQLPTIGTTAGATAILEVPPPCLRCSGLGRCFVGSRYHRLPPGHLTAGTRQAGKRSLDAGGAPMVLLYDSDTSSVPTGIAPADA